MYRDNNFHSRGEVLRVSVSENHESGKHKLIYVLSRLPGVRSFQDELEARKSLRAFCLQPKT